MKKINLLTLGVLLILGFSCKQANKESTQQQKESKELVGDIFTLIKDSTKVSFTAYKTTEKLPVGGKFMKVDIKDSKSGATALDALNGTTFSIPVSSLFTNDATGTRDPKLLEFFFGAMKNTEMISGVFKKDVDNKCSIDVTLNGETADIPLDYTLNSEKSITFNGTMNLEDWNALEAIASINKACKELHTGKDGISKTWSDVAVQAQVQLQKN